MHQIFCHLTFSLYLCKIWDRLRCENVRCVTGCKNFDRFFCATKRVWYNTEDIYDGVKEAGSKSDVNSPPGATYALAGARAPCLTGGELTTNYCLVLFSQATVTSPTDCTLGGSWTTLNVHLHCHSTLNFNLRHIFKTYLMCCYYWIITTISTTSNVVYVHTNICIFIFTTFSSIFLHNSRVLATTKSTNI